MINASFRRTLVGAAVATALGVLAIPADAAPYRGTFDPVDFEGEYFIDVDPLCLTTTGWKPNAGICAATLTSAVADVVSSSPDPTFVGQLTFAPPAVSSPSELFGIYVSYAGEIDSFDTVLIHHNPALSDSTSDDWWIQFVSGQMPPPTCEYCYGYPAQIEVDQKGVYLYVNETDEAVASAAYTSPGVLQVVPEPGTLALMLGALGGGWLARRRRKDKVPDSS